MTPLTLFPGNSGQLELSASVSADQENFPANSDSEADTATSTVTVLAFAGSLQAAANLSLTVSLENPSYAPTQSQLNLPVVNINTNGTGIVDKTTDVPGTVTITSADGQTTYLPNASDTDDTATFHLHGNSTLLMPKKAYDVSLNTSLDLLATMGLTCPYVTSSGNSTCDKSKKYILLANYDDKTFLRDWSASALANAIPSGGAYLAYTPGSPTPSGTSTLTWWAPHSLFVELYLNGVYEGNYQLIEEVKVDSHRVNITEMTDTDTSGTALTGGYLSEIDQHQDEDFIWVTPQGVDMGLIDPDFSPEIAAQTSYIQSYVDDAEDALFGSTYTSATTGWRAYFDEASAVNFYIVNDIMGNVDGGDFYSSDYYYKDLNNPLLYMGPIWDFDISSGNVNYESIVDPTVPWMQTEAPWYKQWFTDPTFKAAVVQQWNALKNGGVFSSWLTSITQESATLEQSQANNFGRWPMQGIRVWPNAEAAGSYSGEVGFLTNWIDTRMGYLDAEFNSKSPTSTTLNLPSGTLRTGVPATFTAQVNGGTSPSGAVTLFAGSAIAGTGSIDGSGTATIVATLQPGGYTVRAVYNGDSGNALSTSASSSLTVLPALANSAVNLNSSSSSVGPDSAVTLSASVVGNSSSTTPTGAVEFVASGTILGTANLSGGAATFTTTALPSGTDAVSALYMGDSTYSSSSSNAINITVQTGTALTFNTTPAGVPYEIDGQTYTAPLTVTFVAGSTHTISTASETNAGQQNTFVSWSDGGAASHTITVPATATTYTATFTASYLLNAVVNPPTGGTVTAAPTATGGYYAQGTTVSLSAVPNAGYVFAGWTGNVANATAASTAVSMSSPQNVTANFQLANSAVNYGAGFTAGGMSLNGTAALSGTALQLTNGNTYEAASSFYKTPVNVGTFTTDFSFQLINPLADGFTFVLQNQGVSALGGFGIDLGYGTGTAGIQNSVAIKFDLYNNAGEGTDSTGLYTDGAQPTVPATDLTSTGVNLHSGDVFAVHMSYDGTTLTVTITDTVTGATATQSYPVNIPSIVGGNTAFVGFTAGTGGEAATQNILTWSYGQP